MSTQAGQTEESRFARMWQVTWPVLVANLAQILLVVTDTVLLGRYSTQALGAIALAAPVYLVATVVVRGWGTAAQVLVARRYGAGEQAQVARVADVGLALGVAGGLVTALALFGFAPGVLALIGGDTGLEAPAPPTCASWPWRCRSWPPPSPSRGCTPDWARPGSPWS